MFSRSRISSPKNSLLGFVFNSCTSQVIYEFTEYFLQHRNVSVCQITNNRSWASKKIYFFNYQRWAVATTVSTYLKQTILVTLSPNGNPYLTPKTPCQRSINTHCRRQDAKQMLRAACPPLWLPDFSLTQILLLSKERSAALI